MPTTEQARIIDHNGSAFVTACPGAGKTRVLVERARLLFKDRTIGKGIAVLSFTNAAVSELEQRLRREGLLPSPTFPNFIGTFDSFLWQFLVAPFGVPGCERTPRLIPDKDSLTIQPYEGAHKLPLKCFDKTTGEVVRTVAVGFGFNPDRNPALTRSYVTTAASVRQRLLERGELDFDDARGIAQDRLKDKPFSSRLAAALVGRFIELIVDEAQDCSPADLEIIQWLRNSGLATKVICDPHQSIYKFRGGITEELIAFGQQYDNDDQLLMSGNFRSSGPICKAIVALRPIAARARADLALGEHSGIVTPIYILAYSGRGVPATVGAKFHELVEAEGIDLSLCPVLASTWHSAAKAIGQPISDQREDLTLRLALAVTSFHFAFETGNRRKALEEVHSVVLEIEGRLGDNTYHQFLGAEAIGPRDWRPSVLRLVHDLRYDAHTYPDPAAWRARAMALLEPFQNLSGRSIAQRLPRNSGLGDVLRAAPTASPPAQSIHAVKGREFPAVCVVMTVPTARHILAYLETGAPADRAEDARKIYVAASRAQRLLAIATPRSQAERLEAMLVAARAPVSVVDA